MERPIGISDSGVGGLSIASKMFTHLPKEEIIYFGDTANVPYGEKPSEQIRQMVFRIMDFFTLKNTKAVIMACNTSSAIVLDEARKRYDMPIIGVIEPAIRESLRVSPYKKIGLIANSVTVASGEHQRLITKISGNGVKIHSQACPQLVSLVEHGILSGKMAEKALREYLHPLQIKGIDTLILGCTHYPFMEDTIRKIIGNLVNIVDPSELTVLSMKELLEKNNLARTKKSACRHDFFVSGDPAVFQKIGSMFLGRPINKVTQVKI